MKRFLGGFLLVLAALGLPLAAVAQDSGEPKAPAGGRAIMLEVDGAIGPATTDYLTRALEHAQEDGDVRLVILRMDTPGGLVAATRDIVQAIRSSTVPVATWVAPEGARAASAGTYILYASHIAAMAPATNVGAATPVTMGGTPSPGPQGEQQPQKDDKSGDGGTDDGGDAEQQAPAGDAHMRKAVHDAAAWIRSLAQETGRNEEWAEKAVREAVSLTAREAVDMNVADFIADSVDELLDKADGRTVQMASGKLQVQSAGLTVERRAPDWRSELLAVITNPTVAYILMMIGIYGLLLEGYNPGSIVPGTVGAISLLLALYAFQVLPVNYAGLLLIILGIILIVSEAFMPSFGALGIGGVVAMVVGSVILMDTEAPGFQIALEVIVSMALFASVLMAAIVMLAVRAWRRPVVSGSEGVESAAAEVIEPVDEEGGTVYLQGERWNARSDQPIPAGARVRVTGRDGLVLHVEPDEHTGE